MKLKAIGFKFAIGTFLLFVILYVFTSCSLVFTDVKYTLEQFQYAQFQSENAALVILDNEGTFLFHEEYINGSVSLEDSVIYLDAEQSYSFVIVSEDSLFFTNTITYLNRVRG